MTPDPVAPPKGRLAERFSRKATPEGGQPPVGQPTPTQSQAAPGATSTAADSQPAASATAVAAPAKAPVPGRTKRWTLFVEEDVFRAVSLACATQSITRTQLMLLAWNRHKESAADLVLASRRVLSEEGDPFVIVAAPIASAKRQVAVTPPQNWAAAIDAAIEDLRQVLAGDTGARDVDRSMVLNLILRAYLNV